MKLSEKDFFTFVENGRPGFNDFCLIWCECRFQDPNERVYYFRQQTWSDGHAEHLLLDKLHQIEHDIGYFREVKMYTSFSPCDECAGKLIQFARERRGSMILDIICTALHYHEDEANQHGLRCLSNQQNVYLRVINNEDWQYLSGIRGNQYRYRDGDDFDLTSRDVWDNMWDEQLHAVINNCYDDLLGIRNMDDIVDDIVSDKMNGLGGSYSS